MSGTLCAIITIYTCSTWSTDLKLRASIVCGDNWQTSSCGLFPHSFRTSRGDTTGLYCFWRLMSVMTPEASLPGSAVWLVKILAWGLTSNINPISLVQKVWSSLERQFMWKAGYYTSLLHNPDCEAKHVRKSGCKDYTDKPQKNVITFEYFEYSAFYI